jgi:membrane protein implicated in regulation of membrane protease activity
MLSFLVAPEFQPFSVAALVMIGLLVIETASTLIGVSTSSLLDSVFGLHGVHVELHHGIESHAPDTTSNSGIVHGTDGPFATVFNWLNAGRVPLLVLMMAAIACFAAAGMVLQIIAMHLVAPLPTAVAVVVAAVVAVPGTRWTSRVVSWVIPRDETYALSDEDLIGRVGIVTLGPVVVGAAARAKVQDKYGNWHFPRVTTGVAGVSIPQGASVLIVEKVGGEYSVIAADGRLASTTE